MTVGRPLSLTGKSLRRLSVEGYHTVYTHSCLPCPLMIAQLGSIKHFSGQGMHRLHIILNLSYMLYVHMQVWKRITTTKRNYFSTNRHDAAKEILATEARLETLRNGMQDRENCIRRKRKHEKSDSVYWNESIRTQRRSTQTPSTYY